MCEKIEAALTPAEWNAMEKLDGLGEGPRVRNGFRVVIDAGTAEWEAEDKRHAIAALALLGQPFGFTRFDVETLRGAAATIDDEWGLGWRSECADLRRLAARISALLPPETP
jgi:hypothetical protein